MVRHDQARDDFAPDDVAFHDFRDIRLGFDAVPDAFRVDNHAWTFGAMVQAPGLVRADDVLQVEPLCFLLEAGVDTL